MLGEKCHYIRHELLITEIGLPRLKYWKTITIFQEQEPTNIKWSDAGDKCVVESIGVFITVEKTRVYLKGGSKRAIICAPSADAPCL